MKKTFSIILILFFSAVTNSVASEVLSKVSEKISSTLGSLIPGDGITETSVKINDTDEDEVNISILGVRDISSTSRSNLFTQFSIHNQEIAGEERYIGNLGIGYRILNTNKTMMFGVNSFYDRDIKEDHSRASVGLEARASVIEFSLNHYQKLTDHQLVNLIKEQVLSGTDYNISTQIPYMPWATFNFQGYEWEKDKAANDTEGKVYSLEMALTPSFQLDLFQDVSSEASVDDIESVKLSFVYPPRENKKTLTDGFVSNVAFDKKNVEDQLRDKVRRNNNLTVEIQGAVIFTKK